MSQKVQCFKSSHTLLPEKFQIRVLKLYSHAQYRVGRENDYNYIDLCHSDLRGCGGQNSFAINEYIAKLLNRPENMFVFTISEM